MNGAHSISQQCNQSIPIYKPNPTLAQLYAILDKYNLSQIDYLNHQLKIHFNATGKPTIIPTNSFPYVRLLIGKFLMFFIRMEYVCHQTRNKHSNNYTNKNETINSNKYSLQSYELPIPKHVHYSKKEIIHSNFVAGFSADLANIFHTDKSLKTHLSDIKH